ncbi:hypothetical protein WOLCODRAFT_136065 [Wolfiporia cocos MD-104 SS10]|uniref:Uncharacterized protein n=1 Tax=Wolfiporia cocos (strain MD-104) TaxID=742152 RepID=A0A2H3J7A5_WOLCO|nr:hypothetical protein WOLCODRAFT_136065 [Wolfiporia cocos MD-104 SS10]
MGICITTKWRECSLNYSRQLQMLETAILFQLLRINRVGGALDRSIQVNTHLLRRVLQCHSVSPDFHAATMNRSQCMSELLRAICGECCVRSDYFYRVGIPNGEYCILWFSPIERPLTGGPSRWCIML